MPRLDLNDRICVFFERKESADVLFIKREDQSRPVRLCPEQVAELFISLNTIDEEATTAWVNITENEKHDFSHHLGWGIFLTVMPYRGKRYYDIRKWWMPQNSPSIKARRTGIRLGEREFAKLNDLKAVIFAAIPEIERAEPCLRCRNQSEYMRCERCQPFDTE